MTNKQIKEKRLELDNKKCRRCGSKKELIAHHIEYSRYNDELIEDIVILCKYCHGIIHNYKNVKSFKRDIVLELSRYREIIFNKDIFKLLNKPKFVKIDFSSDLKSLTISRRDYGFSVIPKDKSHYKIYFSKLAFFECTEYNFNDITFIDKKLIIPIKQV